MQNMKPGFKNNDQNGIKLKRIIPTIIKSRQARIHQTPRTKLRHGKTDEEL